MGLSILYTLNHKCKVFAIGNLLNNLTQLSVFYKDTIERVAKEKHLNIDEATRFVNECLMDALPTLK